MQMEPPNAGDRAFLARESGCGLNSGHRYHPVEGVWKHPSALSLSLCPPCPRDLGWVTSFFLVPSTPPPSPFLLETKELIERRHRLGPGPERWERGRSLGRWLSGSKYLWSWNQCQAQCWVWRDKEASEAEFQTRRLGEGVDNAGDPGLGGQGRGRSQLCMAGCPRAGGFPWEPQSPSQEQVQRALPLGSLPRLSPTTGVPLLSSKGPRLARNQESSGAAAACSGLSP